VAYERERVGFDAGSLARSLESGSPPAPRKKRKFLGRE
jgi:hypothetical protein